MDNATLKNITEAALLAAGGSLSLDQLQLLFEEKQQPEKKDLREALEQLNEDYAGRGMQLVQTGSGWRIQVRADYADWVSRLWDEKPARYSRALMETLALIAYRQPITRGEIEDVRGVSVSSNIIRTLLEREWVRVVGHRDVPGKPALYATTRIFLDYFNLKSLNDLPSLAEIRDLDSINQELALDDSPNADPESGAETDEKTTGETASTDDEPSAGVGTRAGVETGSEAETESETGPIAVDVSVAEPDQAATAEQPLDEGEMPDNELAAQPVEADETPNRQDRPNPDNSETLQPAEAEANADNSAENGTESTNGSESQPDR